jgi:glutamate-1-semialdehyde 2,1-aminomutase
VGDLMSIEEEFESRRHRSRELFERQRKVVPGGFTHMSRVLSPFPLFIEASRGAHKWDVDGHQYVDYWMGHGAMLLGHAHPEVVAALAHQAANGLHAGGETELGMEWAELIAALVPSARAVRFMASGNEATQMAFRVARAVTGRSKILKFHGGFHGWHDAASVAVVPPYDVPTSIGIPKEVADTVVAVPFADAGAVEDALDTHADIAAIVLEPGGLYTDTVPSDPEFVRQLRDLASNAGALLIFDEVVTGFRYARGGVQEAFGVMPDLTVLGKVVGGGLPVGVLAGRADIMEVLAWQPDAHRARFGMIPHSGTWNANPAVAAAGVATLRLVRDSDAVARAIQQASRIVDGLNAVFEQVGLEAFAYGRGGLFKTCLGKPPRILHGDLDNKEADIRQLLNGWGSRGVVLRKAMICQGVDLVGKDGFVSAVHSDTDIEATCLAMESALARMTREGHIKSLSS